MVNKNIYGFWACGWELLSLWYITSVMPDLHSLSHLPGIPLTDSSMSVTTCPESSREPVTYQSQAGPCHHVTIPDTWAQWSINHGGLVVTWSTLNDRVFSVANSLPVPTQTVPSPTTFQWELRHSCTELQRILYRSALCIAILTFSWLSLSTKPASTIPLWWLMKFSWPSYQFFERYERLSGKYPVLQR